MTTTTPLIFKGAYPIGGDVMGIPVKEIPPAVGYYVNVLGFSVLERTDKTAKLQRDEATIGLSVNGEDPEQASVYFEVSNVEALHAELEAKGIAPSPLRTDLHDGETYRVCFAKEPYGVCFCFGTKQS